MSDVNKDTILEFFAIVFVAAGTLCINNIQNKCLNLEQCIIFCLISFVTGISIIYFKYYTREKKIKLKK